MATIIYRTGNGYSCGCCRQTWSSDLYFDEDNIQGAIDACIDIAKAAEWDFSIDNIYEFDREDISKDALENMIMDAVRKAEVRHEHKQKIDRLEGKIEDIDKWFATLDQTKEAKSAEREKYKAELAALGA